MQPWGLLRLASLLRPCARGTKVQCNLASAYAAMVKYGVPVDTVGEDE